MKIPLVATLLATLLLCSTGGAQKEAEWRNGEGIVYYLAAGDHASGHALFGTDSSGASQADFSGCIHMQLRENPVRDVGRAQVISKLGHDLLHFDFTSFRGELNEMDGGLARNVDIDGSHVHAGAIQHPAVKASMAGWGSGTLTVGRFPYADPVTGSSDFQASMFVTPQSFRDDESGAIHNIDGEIWQPGERARLGQDWEIHLRIENPVLARQPDETHSFSRPESLGHFMPQEGYSEAFFFTNTRYGGTATLQIEAESLAPAGANQMAFRFRDPHGTVVDDVVLEPSVGSSRTHSSTVPLDQFGKYSWAVSGNVSLSRYTVSLTFHAPERFDLSLWWDNVTFGPQSTALLRDCEDEVGIAEEWVTIVVDQVLPPPFEWGPVGIGVAAVALAMLTGGKLIHSSLVGQRRK